MMGRGGIIYGVFALALVGSAVIPVSAQELEPDTLKVCEKQLKSKNSAESFVAAWRLSGHYRAKGELKTAEKILKDVASTRDFDRLPQGVALEKLRCILEMAHVKALQDDVNGSLALLNWAEQRKDEFQRSVSLIKYAEILLDLGEFERGGEYQKSGDKLIVKNLGSNPDGAAIGQGDKGIDKSAAWRELKLKSDDLARELEFEMMKQKYGASYALYVKLRRCQILLKKNFIPRYRKEAFAIADEIIETDPKSQFAEAAKYLKGEILATRLTDESDKKQIKEAKEYLGKFVQENPDGLYRGEALMLLGKISLECEWNAKESEQYYKDALAYFQKIRGKRDSFSLYAPLSDELKRQSEPTQKPTSLDRWSRVKFNPEDPLKLYNPLNAPQWYIDSQEKEAFLWLGFFAFFCNDFEQAKKHWMAGSRLDTDQLELQKKRLPNLGGRLCGVADQKFVCALPDEIKNLSSLMRLKINYAEMLYVQEKFTESFSEYEKLLKKRDSYDANTLAVILGNAGDTLKVRTVDGSHRAIPYYRQIMESPKLSKTPTASRVMFYCAEAYHQSNNPEWNKKSIPLYLECAEKNKKTKIGELALFKAAILLGVSERYNEAEAIVKKLKKEYPESAASKRIDKVIAKDREELEKCKKLNAERMKQNEARRKKRLEKIRDKVSK